MEHQLRENTDKATLTITVTGADGSYTYDTSVDQTSVTKLAIQDDVLNDEQTLTTHLI